MKKLQLILALFLALALQVPAQDKGMLSGTGRDSLDRPVELANVALLGTGEGAMTDLSGYYELEIPADKSFTLVISCVGYKTDNSAIRLSAGENRIRDFKLETDIRAIQEVSVSGRQERASTFQRIDVEDLTYMPTTTGKVDPASRV